MKPRYSKNRSASVGMTLIELMVALVIFAMLGVMSYRAVVSMIDSQQHLAAEFARWREISRFLRMAEIDLTQSVMRPDDGRAGTNLSLLLDQGPEKSSELTFIKLDGASNTVRRRGYRLEQQHIQLLRWPGTDTVSTPTQDVVLENVSALRMVVLTDHGQKNAVWPPGPAISSPSPVAIELELELPDVGKIRRIYPIR